MKKHFPTLSQLLLAVILLLINVSGGKAQKSFYQRDRATIKEVRIITLEGVNPHYSFAVVNKGKTTHWGPEEVSAYRKYYGNLYISREIEPGHWAFLELVQEGALNFYYLKDRDLEDRYYLERSDGVFIEITNEKRKDSYYFKVIENEWVNCPQLDRYIKETTFTKAGIARIIKSHNTCKRILNPALRHSVALGLGLSNYHVANSRNVDSAIPIGGLRRGSYEPKLSYYLGYNLEIPILSTNTSITTGLRFHKINSFYNILLGFGEVDFTIDANTMDIGIPVGMMQNLLVRNLKAFFSFEVVPSYHIINDVNTIFNVIDFTGELRTTFGDFSTAEFAVASNLCVGVKIPMGNNHEIAAKLGYDLRLGTGNRRIFNVSTPFIMVYYSL